MGLDGSSAFWPLPRPPAVTPPFAVFPTLFFSTSFSPIAATGRRAPPLVPTILQGNHRTTETADFPVQIWVELVETQEAFFSPDAATSPGESVAISAAYASVNAALCDIIRAAPLKRSKQAGIESTSGNQAKPLPLSPWKDTFPSGCGTARSDYRLRPLWISS